MVHSLSRIDILLCALACCKLGTSNYWIWNDQILCRKLEGMKYPWKCVISCKMIRIFLILWKACKHQYWGRYTPHIPYITQLKHMSWINLVCPAKLIVTVYWSNFDIPKKAHITLENIYSCKQFLLWKLWVQNRNCERGQEANLRKNILLFNTRRAQ